MAGYTRQSLADIQDGEDIVAAPLNAEFDQLQDAFNAVTGHTHDGTIGNSPKIVLTAGAAVSGTLPVTNGGTGLSTVAIDQVLYSSALNTLTATPITAFGRSLIDDADATTARATLGLTYGTQVQAWDAALQSISGLTTAADTMIYTTALDTYATTPLTSFARTILDDANASAVRTTLGLQAIASTGSASDLITGTIADARLPTSMAGKTFTSQVTISSGNLVVGASTYQSDGNIVFSGGMLGYGNSLSDALVSKANLSGATFTGDIYVPQVIATSGNMYIRATGNRILWFQTSAGVNRSAFFHDNANDGIQINLYNSAGTFIREFIMREAGGAYWRGQMLQIGAESGTAELRLNAGTNWDYRMLGDTGGQFFIQKSTNEWAGATTLMYFDGVNNGFVTNNLYAARFLPQGSIGYGADNGLLAGSGDNATYAAHNVRIGTWFGLGIYDTSSNTCRIVFDARSGHITHTGNLACGGVVYAGGGTAALYTDGNVQFAGTMQTTYGTYLSDALSAAQWRTQTWQNVAGSRVAGTSYQNTTGRPIMVSIQGTDSSSFEVSSNNSTWLTLADGDGDTDAGVHVTGGIIIPPNWYYRCNTGFTRWHELR